LTATVSDFYARTERFVKEKLRGYYPEKLGKKVIHDTIWGSVVYNGWEIQLVDSPLFQRLRDIQQLGRAEMTYPAARHTRFEHSLGVVAIAARMMEKLRERSDTRTITDADINKVRLAALLHDVGHCFYSHLSERVYSKLPEFKEMREYVCREFEDGVSPQPHELFSYLIVKSRAFAEFFYERISYPEKGDLEDCIRLLDECANIIIGRNNVSVVNGRECVDAFMTSVVNGSFDADKLDYTQRDSYTSGIALSYGVDRFLMKILVCEEQDEKGRTVFGLAVSSDVVTTIEELLFNRGMLYVYMYRHQKVLAAEAVVRAVIYALLALGKLKHPCDFLELTDRDIEESGHSNERPFENSEKTLGEIVCAVKYRALPKRASEISAAEVCLPELDEKRIYAQNKFLQMLEREQNEQAKRELLQSFTEAYHEAFSESGILLKKATRLEQSFGFRDFESYMEMRRTLHSLIRSEYESAGRECDVDLLDIHIDFPQIASDKSSFPVFSKQDGRLHMHTFKYIKDWSRAFNASNWRGYFFTATHVENDLVRKAISKFIAERCQGCTIKNNRGKNV